MEINVFELLKIVTFWFCCPPMPGYKLYLCCAVGLDCGGGCLGFCLDFGDGICGPGTKQKNFFSNSSDFSFENHKI